MEFFNLKLKALRATSRGVRDVKFSCSEYHLRDAQLLNAGIIGGKYEIVTSFIKNLVDCYFLERSKENICDFDGNIGAMDMGLFNYIAYTMYYDLIKHGAQVNTVFGTYTTNNYSWFKHK